MPDNNSTTTTTTPGVSSNAAAVLAGGIPAPTSTVNVGNGPTYLGVGYATNDSGQDLVVWPDGSTSTIDPQTGKPADLDARTKAAGGTAPKFVVIHPGQVVTTTDGVPVPQAAPVTQQLPLPASRVAGGDTTNIGSVTTFVPARYRTGDEVSELGGMAPEQRAQIVAMMKAKGLIPAQGDTPNDWWSGMKQVMTMANASGSDWQTELQNLPTQATAPQRKAYNVQLDNPADLKAIFQKAIQDHLGGGTLPNMDAEVQKFVDGYQQVEKNNQMQAVQAQEAANTALATGQASPDVSAKRVTSRIEPGSPAAAAANAAGPQTTPDQQGPVTFTTTNPVSAQQYAQNMIQQDYGAQVNQYALLGTYNQFMSLIGQGIK